MNSPKKKSFKKFIKKKPIFKTQKKGKLEKEEIDILTESKLKLGELNPAEITNFKLLPLSDETQNGLLENGFNEPTKVQRQTLIHSLRGLDVVAAAKTGSGKTLAFIIPLLELLYSKMWSQLDGLGALIITPTRELAYQIFEVLNKVGKRHSFSVGLIIGGKDLKFEWFRIQRCNIMICTPGRLLQHMTENPEFSCENTQLLVLDEADQCLSMGFADTMNLILEELPTDRQTLLFSATQTRDVNDLIRAGCKDPVFCSVHEHSKTVTPKTLKESYIVCSDSDKVTFLWSFLKHHKRHKILVFLATCKQVKFIYDLFTHLRPGLTVMGLRGDMHQLRRMAIYDEFCKKKHAVLFATDVAARGLDIPYMDWVIQVDCPEDATTYIHRAGRTARYIRSGEALLLLTPSQAEPMVANLKMKSIPIEKIDVDPNKLQSIQLKVEFVLSKYFNLKEAAERAFKAYLKNISHMKNRKVFDVTSIDMDALSRSFGLTVTPRVRFIERQLKNQLSKESTDSISSFLDPNNKPVKTFSLGITQDDDSDDDFLSRSKSQPLSNQDEPEDILNDLVLFTKKNKEFISKQDLAKKIIKNKLQVNKKIVFNDEGEAISANAKQQAEEKITASEDKATGISLSEMQELLKAQDKIDKRLNEQRLREKQRKKREKLKEERALREETKKREKEGEGDNEYEKVESDSDDDDDAFTSDIIDELPDPDNVYDEKKMKSSNESESEQNDSEVETKTESPSDENEKGIKQKRDFRGKRKAIDEARKAKRTRVEAENDFNSISFDEREDLALFLLKSSR